MDFDLKLEPNGSFAILTNYKDVTLPSVIERQRAMKMFAGEYGVDCPPSLVVMAITYLSLVSANSPANA